jgi:polyferredoxin
MARIGRPAGLIRLTSHDAVLTGQLRWWTGRISAYAAVWLVLLVTVTVMVTRRPDLDVLVLRQPGTLFATLPDGEIANFYNVQVFNRTRDNRPFEIVVTNPKGASVTPLNLLSPVGPHALLEGRLLVTVAAGQASGVSTPVTLEVRQDGKAVQTISSSFIGPTPGP